MPLLLGFQVGQVNRTPGHVITLGQEVAQCHSKSHFSGIPSHVGQLSCPGVPTPGKGAALAGLLWTQVLLIVDRDD